MRSDGVLRGGATHADWNQLQTYPGGEFGFLLLLFLLLLLLFAVFCSTPAPGNDQDSYDVDNRFAESPIAPWREGWTVGFVWHGSGSFLFVLLGSGFE